MPQGVYVDSRNNVRVVDVGPIGPPGFAAGSDPAGPVELLPMTVSRLVPFVGWTQLGMPFNTMAWYGYRLALAFPSIPLLATSVESSFMPMAPFYIAKEAETVNYMVSAFGIDFVSNDFPSGAQLQVVMTTGDVLGGGLTERIIGTAPFPAPNYVSLIGPEGDFESLIEDNAMQFEFELEAGEAISGIMMTLIDENGDPFSPSASNLAVALMRTSLWSGPASASAHVDPYRGATYLSQLVESRLGSTYNYGLFGNTLLMVNGSGLSGTGVQFTPDGIVTEGLEATMLMEPDHESSPTFVRWRANRLAVDTPPVDGTDVLRLMDAPDFTPTGLRQLSPVENKIDIIDEDLVSPSDGTIYEMVLTVPYTSVSFSWANVPPGFVATPMVVVRNSSDGPISLTVNGADGFSANQTIGASEIWLVQSRVVNKTPGESPDLGVVQVAYTKIYSPTVLDTHPEIPKIGLTTNALVGGKVPVNYNQIEMGVGDGSELEFTNPGDGRYSIFTFSYRAGALGEPFTVLNSSNYEGGTPSDPGVLIPDQLYVWTVYVGGTESGPPYVDFRQEYP